jgi:hypothetical protein
MLIKLQPLTLLEDLLLNTALQLTLHPMDHMTLTVHLPLANLPQLVDKSTTSPTLLTQEAVLLEDSLLKEFQEQPILTTKYQLVVVLPTLTLVTQPPMLVALAGPSPLPPTVHTTKYNKLFNFSLIYKYKLLI